MDIDTTTLPSIIDIDTTSSNDKFKTTTTFDVRVSINFFFKILLYTNFDETTGFFYPLIDNTVCTHYNFSLPITSTSKKEITEDFISKAIQSPSKDYEYDFLYRIKDVLLNEYKRKFKNTLQCIDKLITRDNIHILNIRVNFVEISKRD